MKRSRRRLLRRLRYLLGLVALASAVLTVLGYVIIRLVFSGTLTTVGEYWALATALMIYLVLTALFARRSRKRFARPTAVDPEALGSRLDELSQTLDEAGRSFKGIERDILVLESDVRTLTVKTEQLSTATAMDEEDADLISELLTRKVASQLKELKRDSRISFALGLLCSVPVGIFVNILTR